MLKWVVSPTASQGVDQTLINGPAYLVYIRRTTTRSVAKVTTLVTLNP